MAKTHSFHQKFGLAFKDETSKFVHLEHSFAIVHLEHSFAIEHFGKRSEISEKFLTH